MPIPPASGAAFAAPSLRLVPSTMDTEAPWPRPPLPAGLSSSRAPPAWLEERLVTPETPEEKLPTKLFVAPAALAKSSPARSRPAAPASFAFAKMSRAEVLLCSSDSAEVDAVGRRSRAGTEAPRPGAGEGANTPSISGDRDASILARPSRSVGDVGVFWTRAFSGSATTGAISRARSMRISISSTGGNLCKRRRHVPKSSAAMSSWRRKRTIAAANASMTSRTPDLLAAKNALHARIASSKWNSRLNSTRNHRSKKSCGSIPRRSRCCFKWGSTAPTAANTRSHAPFTSDRSKPPFPGASSKNATTRMGVFSSGAAARAARVGPSIALNMAYASCSTYAALSSGAPSTTGSRGGDARVPHSWPSPATSDARWLSTSDASSCMPCLYPTEGFSRDQTVRISRSAA
mmetsp:Transcript_5832/g.24707  ORF Transcript_5832/g.24707 Transcript_5832/m.24707 type:complete len:405 (+) Transcript_5832:327-1541(+)